MRGNRNNSSVCISLLVVLVCSTGCMRPTGTPEKDGKQVLTAKYARAPLEIDGKLDDPAWKEAAPYPLAVSKDKETPDAALVEGGEVRLAWDDDYLYVGVWFDDSDIVAEGKEDNMRHFRKGDVLEVFLKPDESNWYWELYATPLSKKSTLFFPGGGRLGLESPMAYRCDLRVGAFCDGSVNHWQDTDRGWSAEMAVPVKALTSLGNALGPGSKWRILIGRYNYSAYLPRKELSMTPQLPWTDFHLREDYGRMEFVK